MKKRRLRICDAVINRLIGFSPASRSRDLLAPGCARHHPVIARKPRAQIFVVTSRNL